MVNKIHVYVGSIVVAALVSLAAVAEVAPAADGPGRTAVLTLCALAIAAEIFSYDLSDGARGSITFIPYLAALLVSPSALCVTAFAGALMLPHAVRRPPPVRLLFNGAQTTLTGALAVLVFQALGGSAMTAQSVTLTGGLPVGKLLAIASLVLVFMTSNSLVVSGIIALNHGRPILAGWKQAVNRTLAYDLVVSPAVYFVAFVFLRWGVGGVLLLTIPMLVVRQLYHTNSQLERVNQELLELMVKAIEARDPYTSGHSRRVSQYSKIIARAVGLNGGELERVGIAALLHDVGKIHEIYAPILRKPEKLSPAEWAVMQTHPIKSAELVSTVSHLKDIVAPVKHHHENWDGTGYPDGLAGTQIPIGSRVVLFADTIDAMTTDRPYRKALTESQVRAEIVKFRGKQFDPDMCDRLIASPMFGLLFAPNQRESTPESTKLVLEVQEDRAISQS